MLGTATSCNDLPVPPVLTQSPDTKPLGARPSGPLAGRVTVPGDKSISHRALMLGALAIGETRISGLLESGDVMATAAAMRAFGATIVRDADAGWSVYGLGTGGLLEPEGAIDFGNAGTGVRLAMGIAGAHAFATTFVGDAIQNAALGKITPEAAVAQMDEQLRFQAEILAR